MPGDRCYRVKRLTILLLCAALSATALAAAASESRSRGEAQMRAGDLEAAAASLEQAVSEAPGDAAAHHLLGAAYGLQASRGSMFSKMRLAGKMREHFERAVELAPDELDYRESLLQYYAQAPAVAGGGADKARAQAAEIARRDPVRGLLARATVLRVEGKPEEAIAAYRQAYKARPEDGRVGLGLAIYLQELQRFDEAFAHLRQVVERTPGLLGAWYQIGRTAVLASANHAEGEAAFRRFLAGTPGANDPPLAAAHWRLGMLYEQMGRKADARTAYQEALRLDPKNAEAGAALKKLK